MTSEGIEELDAFLEAHGLTEAVAPKRKAALKAAHAKAQPGEKKMYRCSCGWEGTDHGIVKGHAWKGHLYHMVNQKPWSES